MANARKSPSRTPSSSRKRADRTSRRPVRLADWDSLTPSRVRQVWELHHPERPEVRAMLERLYRQRY